MVARVGESDVEYRFELLVHGGGRIGSKAHKEWLIGRLAPVSGAAVDSAIEVGTTDSQSNDDDEDSDNFRMLADLVD